ncbi:phage tail tube protein [Kribbella sp. CA-293567]|uniref:phage tail tube protein n=1 Tax=Kribbella sp. CA-293567 TaxID=3002436 RepID=UPI0022DD2AB2|nr:hypothetical protein [Kribbella sp. CA-293567]WBQ03024.1 hypothetical protein OX958_23940 [Kribbella sp. CA-293567]
MADIPSTPADGNVKALWVPSILNPEAPTLVELTAGTVKDFSCYLTADGWTPGLDEQVIADSRLCEIETFEQPGRVARTLTSTYIDNSNTALPNDAFNTLIPGSVGNWVTRRGKAWDLPIIAGDKVDIWPTKCGQYSDLPPEANSVLKVAQKQFITSRVRLRRAVV